MDRPGAPSQGTTLPAASIPALQHAEAMTMAREELDRFLDLLGQFDRDDWDLSTVCTDWDVRQVVAHVSATSAGFVRGSDLRRAISGRLQRPHRQRGLDRLGAMNQIGVDDRADRNPTELIAELRDVGPRAIERRKKLPNALRGLPLPMGLAFPFGKTWVPLGYLTDLIMTRDVWIHRLDLCRATGREMVLTAEHDGRITALVVRELADHLAKTVGETSVVLHLTGPAGGRWSMGDAAGPGATITMDACDLHWLAAGRTTAAELQQNGLVSVDGDSGVANRVLENTSAVY